MFYNNAKNEAIIRKQQEEFDEQERIRREKEEAERKQREELYAMRLDNLRKQNAEGYYVVNIPGDTSPEIISAIIADEAAIGMINNKATAVRVIPAIGKQVGEELEFGGLLGSGPVMPVNPASPARFIHRGGRIPAPLQAVRN